jgi:hypothetical protein
MIKRGFQFFFVASFSFLAVASVSGLEQGRVYPLDFTDVEGRQLSLHDGYASLVTVTTRENETKAHRVGDSVPEKYVGHPRNRCVTVINFQNQIRPFLRRVIRAIVRHRFRVEADQVQSRYQAKKIAHSPRDDLFAIADFDGNVVRQLGIDPASNEFDVFVFDGRGRLIRQWHDVPSTAELDSALASAQ